MKDWNVKLNGLVIKADLSPKTELRERLIELGIIADKKYGRWSRPFMNAEMIEREKALLIHRGILVPKKVTIYPLSTINATH